MRGAVEGDEEDDGMYECQWCMGDGVITQLWLFPDAFGYEKDVTCPHCGGTGRVSEPLTPVEF